MTQARADTCREGARRARRAVRREALRSGARHESAGHRLTPWLVAVLLPGGGGRRLRGGGRCFTVECGRVTVTGVHQLSCAHTATAKGQRNRPGTPIPARKSIRLYRILDSTICYTDNLVWYPIARRAGRSLDLVSTGPRPSPRFSASSHRHSRPLGPAPRQRPGPAARQCGRGHWPEQPNVGDTTPGRER